MRAGEMDGPGSTTAAAVSSHRIFFPRRQGPNHNESDQIGFTRLCGTIIHNTSTAVHTLASYTLLPYLYRIAV